MIAIDVFFKEFVEFVLALERIVFRKCISKRPVASHMCDPVVPVVQADVGERPVNRRVFFYRIHSLGRRQRILYLNDVSKQLERIRIRNACRLHQSGKSARIVQPVHRTYPVGRGFLIASLDLPAKAVPGVAARASVFRSHRAAARHSVGTAVADKRHERLYKGQEIVIDRDQAVQDVRLPGDRGHISRLQRSYISAGRLLANDIREIMHVALLDLRSAHLPHVASCHADRLASFRSACQNGKSAYISGHVASVYLRRGNGQSLQQI